MTDLASTTEDAPKLIARRDTKLLLAGACLAVIGVGAWLAPRKAATQATAPPPEAAAPLLQQEQERRAPEALFRNAYERGAALSAHVFTIATLPRARPGTLPDSGPEGDTWEPRGYAVAVDAEHVLTHREALDAVEVRLRAAGDVLREGRVVAVDNADGIALVQLDGAGLIPATPALEPAAAGSGAVAVGRERGGHWAAPVVVAGRSDARYTLAGFGPLGVPGLPVFDVDGRLLAIVTSRAGPHNAVAAEGALERLRRLRSRGGLPRTLGVTLQALEGKLQQQLGTGVLVADVHLEEQTALRPGDIIVKIGSRDVLKPDDVTAALENAAPAEALDVQIRRGRPTLAVKVTPRVALHPVRPVTRTMPAIRADAVFDAESLRAAGVPTDSRIVSIDGSPPTDIRSLRARLRSRRPRLVLFEDAGTRFFAVIDPA